MAGGGSVASPVRVASAGRSSGRRLGGGFLSSSLGENCVRLVFVVVMRCAKHSGSSSPTTSRCLSPLENADDVKGLFPRQRVYCNSPRGAQSNYCHTFDTHFFLNYLPQCAISEMQGHLRCPRRCGVDKRKASRSAIASFPRHVGATSLSAQGTNASPLHCTESTWVGW